MQNHKKTLCPSVPEDNPGLATVFRFQPGSARDRYSVSAFKPPVNSQGH